MRNLLIATGLITLIVLLSFLGFGAMNKAWFVERGPWGDFFGGVANPILTFLTFAGVLAALWFQRAELSMTREEMARSADALENQIDSLAEQKKQNIFFQMLSLHNQILESIDLYNARDNAVTATGRDCFSKFYQRLEGRYKVLLRDGKPDEEAREQAYDYFWQNHQQELGHYYRFLYRMVVFIDREFALDDYYMGLLRAQVSDQEMLLLFYNALTPKGRKFKALIEKWALFDNLPIERLLDGDKQNHAALFDASAYDTKHARELRVESKLA